jgi:hypothetical protein
MTAYPYSAAAAARAGRTRPGEGELRWTAVWTGIGMQGLFCSSCCCGQVAPLAWRPSVLIGGMLAHWAGQTVTCTLGIPCHNASRPATPGHRNPGGPLECRRYGSTNTGRDRGRRRTPAPRPPRLRRAWAPIAAAHPEPETVGQMSCNPAIGGIGKGHLAKRSTRWVTSRPRIAPAHPHLNASKGPAVRATRAQAAGSLPAGRARCWTPSPTCSSSSRAWTT